MNGPGAPLAGRVVAVTRAASQSRDMIAAIRAAGGRAAVYPLIEIVWTGLDRLRGLAASRPDAFVFTSENGVDALSEAMGKAASVREALSVDRAYCVGAATAKRAAELGFAAVTPPGPHTAERLAEFLCAALPAGTRLVWPRGNLADPAWRAPLAAAGIDVSDAVVYETRTGANAGRLARDARSRRVDALTFASASAADAFATAWWDLDGSEASGPSGGDGASGEYGAPHPRVFAIGARTGEALARRGLAVTGYARAATAAALVEAVVAHYRENP